MSPHDNLPADQMDWRLWGRGFAKPSKKTNVLLRHPQRHKLAQVHANLRGLGDSLQARLEARFKDSTHPIDNLEKL